jgi:hypothetical protein
MIEVHFAISLDGSQPCHITTYIDHKSSSSYIINERWVTRPTEMEIKAYY